MLVQHRPTLLGVICCDRLYTMLAMLHHVGTCRVKFEISQTFDPTAANISVASANWDWINSARKMAYSTCQQFSLKLLILPP